MVKGLNVGMALTPLLPSSLTDQLVLAAGPFPYGRLSLGHFSVIAFCWEALLLMVLVFNMGHAAALL